MLPHALNFAGLDTCTFGYATHEGAMFLDRQFDFNIARYSYSWKIHLATPHREDTPEPGNNAREGFFQGGDMSGYQRGYELIAAVQPDAGNELLGDLDDFAVKS